MNRKQRQSHLRCITFNMAHNSASVSRWLMWIMRGRKMSYRCAHKLSNMALKRRKVTKWNRHTIHTRIVNCYNPSRVLQLSLKDRLHWFVMKPSIAQSVASFCKIVEKIIECLLLSVCLICSSLYSTCTRRWRRKAEGKWGHEQREGEEGMRGE